MITVSKNFSWKDTKIKGLQLSRDSCTFELHSELDITVHVCMCSCSQKMSVCTPSTSRTSCTQITPTQWCQEENLWPSPTSPGSSCDSSTPHTTTLVTPGRQAPDESKAAVYSLSWWTVSQNNIFRSAFLLRRTVSIPSKRLKVVFLLTTWYWQLTSFSQHYEQTAALLNTHTVCSCLVAH